MMCFMTVCMVGSGQLSDNTQCGQSLDLSWHRHPNTPVWGATDDESCDGEGFEAFQSSMWILAVISMSVTMMVNVYQSKRSLRATNLPVGARRTTHLSSPLSGFCTLPFDPASRSQHWRKQDHVCRFHHDFQCQNPTIAIAITISYCHHHYHHHRYC